MFSLHVLSAPHGETFMMMLKEERVTTMRLDDLGQSTLLESNKSVLKL
jgi:hypothetical protein